jgi:CheY-like chemotaxis protein
MGAGSLGILLVEDNDVDAEFLLRCLQEHGNGLEAIVAASGHEALAILRGEQGRQPLAGPYVILLDLLLPGMSGFEFLQQLRSDPGLKAITVFVLTQYLSEEYRRTAYEYCIAGYLHKSVFTDNCAPLIRFLEAYGDIIEISIPTWENKL